MQKRLKRLHLHSHYEMHNTVVVAQLVRAPDCGSGGRRFETDLPPKSKKPFKFFERLFLCFKLLSFKSAKWRLNMNSIKPLATLQ